MTFCEYHTGTEGEVWIWRKGAVEMCECRLKVQGAAACRRQTKLERSNKKHEQPTLEVSGHNSRATQGQSNGVIRHVRCLKLYNAFPREQSPK